MVALSNSAKNLFLRWKSRRTSEREHAIELEIGPMKRTHSWVLLGFLVLSPISNSAQALHLFGGSDGDEYMGCLNCSSYDSNSIWNEYGTYGSSYNSESIWNEYGTFGSEYSAYSPWNAYSSEPPGVYDSDGGFYGYLTVNEYMHDRADFDLAELVCEYHELIREDVDGWYNKIFE